MAEPTEEPLTISSVAMSHPTEIQINLSDGTIVRISVDEMKALQAKSTGTKPVFERSGEP